jgi:hypothetical protein
VSEQIEIQPLGEHDYLVCAHYSAGMIESRFRASPDVLDQIGASPAEERRVIEETASYLLAHQSVIDMPPMVDLDDMAAAFDDYLAQMRQRVARS